MFIYLAFSAVCIFKICWKFNQNNILDGVGEASIFSNTYLMKRFIS